MKKQNLIGILVTFIGIGVIGVSAQNYQAPHEKFNPIDTNVAHGNGTQGTDSEAFNNHYNFGH